MKKAMIGFAAAVGLLSCTDESITSGMKDNIKDNTFEFTAVTEHLEKTQATAIHLKLKEAKPEMEFALDYTIDGEESKILKTMSGTTVEKAEPFTTDSEGAISFLIDDTALPKGSHTLSLQLNSEHWKQTLDIEFSISYQPFLMRHTVSTASELSSELVLELVRGDLAAEYDIHCEIKDEYGYSIDRKVIFSESRKKSISLPLIRPGTYELNISMTDGKTSQESTQEITEVLRERYKTLTLELTERPTGEYSVTISENPYKIGLELSSRLTVKGSCEYDDVQSDRDGDWPWHRVAYSEEYSDSENYQGQYSNETLKLHDYMSVHDAIRANKELHAYFSECEGDYGYPSSCVSGYSSIPHQPEEEILEVSLYMTEPVEGVAMKISHDIVQSLPTAFILLNGKSMQIHKAIDCEVKKDEKK